MAPASGRSGAAIHSRLFLLAKKRPGLVPITALLHGLAAIATVTQMYLLARIIDAIFTQHAALAEVQVSLWALLGAVAVRAGVSWSSDLVAQKAANSIKASLREELCRHLVMLGPSFTAGERSGELVSTTIEGVEKFDAYFARFLPGALAMAIIPAIISLVVFSFDWVSGLILAITAPSIFVFMWLIGTLAASKTAQQWDALSRMSAHFLDVIQGLSTLKLFGRSGAQTAHIVEVSDHFRRTTMCVLKVAFLSGLVLELAASVSIALLAVQIGIRLIEGLMPFQSGLFILLLAPEFYLPIRQFGAQHHAGMEGVAAASRIFEVLDARPVVNDSLRNVEPPAQLLTIEFRNVTWRYPEARDPALEDVSFRLEPGRIYALAGPSGSGKSTVLKALLRFIEPQAGVILANGYAITDFATAAWRKRLAFVPQTPHFFEGTVLENLRLARPDASKDEILRAAELAEARGFIERLPQGFDTPAGEAALRFSGGERQRLALARAFLKDAPLLLLDEPSAHLDAENEEKLNRVFMRLARGRTTLIIAHREATLRTADVVINLRRGRIVRPGEYLLGEPGEEVLA
jgi:ATP-binding cassette subfamily C protein CydD